MTKLDVLKSKAFSAVVRCIRDKYWGTAEALLMEMETDQAMLNHKFTLEERIAIGQAMEECWKRVERRY